MSLLGTGRRRRRRVAVAVIGAVTVAAGTLLAPGALAASRPTATAGSGADGAVTKLPAPPAYFIDATSMGGVYSSPVIRASATGKLVGGTPVGGDPALDDYDPPYGLAATGPYTFVVGLMTPTDCSTQFYRFRINDRGRPGALTRVGPTLPGDLTAMAATAGGGLIGYAIDGDGCANARTLGSYLGVLDLGNGRTRRWTDAPAYLTQLSMSAGGRLLAFTQTLTKPASGGGYEITGYRVRTLATDAAPGSVDGRSRVAASIPAQDSLFVAPAVLLSATGTSFYLCAEPFAIPKRGAKKITDTARIVSYRTATGKATGVVAAWSASYPPPKNGSAPLSLSCSTMALDPSGRYLLVPYLETYGKPADPSSIGSLTAVRINIATRARSHWTIPDGDGQGQVTMSIAW
jgi:hypothetical protein